MAGLLLATGVARADDSLVLGILADRDPAAVRAHYRPLVDYFEAQLPDIDLVPAVLALPHVELATQQRLAAVLFALTPGHAVPRVAGIAGFAPPQDTLPAEDLLTALKAPPFDRSPPTSWQALWEQNRRYLVSLAAGLLIVLTLLVELARRNRRLRRQRERTRLANSVFYHTHEGIMVTSPDGCLLEVNPAFTDITGYGREEALGQAANLLRSGHHDAAFYVELWEALENRGQWAGEVWNRHKSGRIYPQRLTISVVRDDDGLVECYVGLLADISSLKTYQQELERIAHYDPLTGLPNRALLADRLRQAMAVSRRRNRRLAVVFIDLDGFKAVNDTHGHAMGDRLLVELARRMQGVLREGDTLARLGGDEFVAVVTDLATPADCHPMLERLLEVAATAVVIDGVALEVSASLGVDLMPVALEVDADQLLRQADQAMYRAKRQGKNRYACAEAPPDKCLAV